MGQRMDVVVGLGVRSRDGRSLGRIVSVADDAFVVERGVFFAHGYRVPFSAVETLHQDDVYLLLDRGQLQKAGLGDVIPMTSRLTTSPGAFCDARMGSDASRDVRREVMEDVEEDVREEGPARPLGFMADPAPHP